MRIHDKALFLGNAVWNFSAHWKLNAWSSSRNCQDHSKAAAKDLLRAYFGYLELSKTISVFSTVNFVFLAHSRGPVGLMCSKLGGFDRPKCCILRTGKGGKSRMKIWKLNELSFVKQCHEGLWLSTFLGMTVPPTIFLVVLTSNAEPPTGSALLFYWFYCLFRVKIDFWNFDFALLATLHRVFWNGLPYDIKSSFDTNIAVISSRPEYTK